MRYYRHGFSLLEVMVALAILVVSLAILLETQASAAFLTREAERMVIATDLAQVKFDEASLALEADGFQLGDQKESGDFDDLGDEAMSLEFGDELEDYHWEYWISEIDVALAGDLAGSAAELESSGVMGGAAGAEDAGAAAGGGLGALGSMASPEMLTQMVAPYIREIRVRIWWGADSKAAEDDGTEVVLVGHAINPSGQVLATGMAGGTEAGAPTP